MSSLPGLRLSNVDAVRNTMEWDRERRENPSLGSFLLPEGFRRPRPDEVLRESSVVLEAARYAVDSIAERAHGVSTPYSARGAARAGDPVILVPGFMAGDTTLLAMSRTLRRRGFRTYRSHIHANVSCTLQAAAQLEARIE